jgi:predicted nucleic acid-binding protein
VRTIFGDTSFFIALLNPKDHLHDQARRLRQSLRPFHMVTSEMVLTELLNDFSARGDVLRQAATALVDQLRRWSRAKPVLVSMVPQTPEQFDAALALYRDRSDKSWSLTDCASSLHMQEHDIREGLTHDQHFVQMGFNALLR